jgi:hypothetical protein
MEPAAAFTLRQAPVVCLLQATHFLVYIPARPGQQGRDDHDFPIDDCVDHPVIAQMDSIYRKDCKGKRSRKKLKTAPVSRW